MLRGFRTVPILLGLAAASPLAVAHSQSVAVSPCGTDSEIPLARVTMGRLCGMLRDTAIQHATGANNAVELISLMPRDIMWRIDDRELTTFFLTYARTLASADTDACAGTLPRPGSRPWSERFMAIAMTVDTATAADWADFLEAWVHAYVSHAPKRAEASPRELDVNLRRYLATMSPADRVNYIRVGRGERVRAEDACRLARVTFEWLASLPAPVGRALMSAQRPWLPAA
jgi:hypothetical protein